MMKLRVCSGKWWREPSVVTKHNQNRLAITHKIILSEMFARIENVEKTGEQNDRL